MFVHVTALSSAFVSALDELHRRWAEDRARAEQDGRDALQRYGEVSSETCSRVVELMRPWLDEIPAQRRAAEAEAARADRWFGD